MKGKRVEARQDPDLLACSGIDAAFPLVLCGRTALRAHGFLADTASDWGCGGPTPEGDKAHMIRHIDTSAAARDAWKLIDHDQLMTPRLIAIFGPIVAHQTASEVAHSTFWRVSEVRQRATGLLLLDADMAINTAALPPGMLDRLLTTDIPFGQLLIDADIAALSTDRQLFERGTTLGEIRYGRTHRIIDTTTGITLCDITELLSRAAERDAARASFLERVIGR